MQSITILAISTTFIFKGCLPHVPTLSKSHNKPTEVKTKEVYAPWQASLTPPFSLISSHPSAPTVQKKPNKFMQDTLGASPGAQQ